MKRIYLFMTLIIFFIFLSSTTFADITYTIERGDSLYKISKKFGVTVNELKTKNNMTSSRLKIGGKIAIPKKEELTREEKDITVKKEPVKQGTDSEALLRNVDETSYHIVKKGDNLWSLSKKYSVSVNEIKEINNLKSTKLKSGQKLLVKRTATNTYTVKKGDSLYRIARKFNIDVDELKDINGLETDRLKSGQKLNLESEEEKENKEMASEVKETEAEDTKEATESEEPSVKEKLALFAKKLINIPYRFGGNSMFGIDCSGYVQKVYSMIGINLPRSAREQFHEGWPVEKEELSIGDLVFFRTYAPFPSHVGIYLGDDLFIHASSEAKKVTINSLNTPYYLKRFIGAKRVIGEDKILMTNYQ